ncbi:MAG: hypothetical protein NDJ18_01720 [candidate division Zixibacteria bacterium]|nr:hypothetical protein [candidate division Zixibacteria bacterium]
MDSLLPILRIFLALALAFAVVGLAHMLRKVRSFGKRELFAEANGTEIDGIRYALGAGMMPWAKESARAHPATYVAGVIYHCGIFAAFLILVLSFLQVEPTGSRLLVVLMSLGLIAGLGLLIKRMITPSLSAISVPDDLVANLLVNLYVASGIAYLINVSWLPLFYLVSILLLIYIPIGKIRHCALFFVTRLIFGRYFGRRGVYPAASAKIKA